MSDPSVVLFTQSVLSDPGFTFHMPERQKVMVGFFGWADGG